MKNSNSYPVIAAISALAVLGCSGAPRGPDRASIPESRDEVETSGRDPESPRKDPNAQVLHWYHDDFESAVNRAKEQNLPLVIDMWANWCHTCLSMKHFVLEDEILRPYAKRFVWLSLDTDKESNTAALELFPVRTWPTFFVIDPQDRAVLTRYQGAASLDQFASFLEQGERIFSDAGRGDEPASQKEDLLRLVRRADQAALREDWATAARLYRSALAAANPAWPRRPDLLVSLIGTLAASEQWSDCVQLGLTGMNDTGSSASAADFAYYATTCAESLDDKDEHKEQLLSKAAVRLSALTADDNARLSVDDRSDALRILRQIQIARGEKQAAIETAEKQLALLDQAASDAPSPQAASTFNWPRAEVYVFLGRGRDLIAALEASSRALPDDFDPPYRLAWVALKVGDLQMAREAAERACRLAYGPRKGRALILLADILKAQGQRSEELRVRKETVEHYSSLPPGHFSQKQLDQARQALEELEKQN